MSVFLCLVSGPRGKPVAALWLRAGLFGEIAADVFPRRLRAGLFGEIAAGVFPRRLRAICLQVVRVLY